MSDEKEDGCSVESDKGKVVRQSYALIAFTSLIILASMLYIYRTGNRLAAVHAPLVDATMKIKAQ